MIGGTAIAGAVCDPRSVPGAEEAAAYKWRAGRTTRARWSATRLSLGGVDVVTHQRLVGDGDVAAPSDGEAIRSQSEGAPVDGPPDPEMRGAGRAAWGGVPKRLCWLAASACRIG